MNINKPLKTIAPKANYAFSLGLDDLTLTELKELQDTPEYLLDNRRLPSRTLIARQAIRFYSYHTSLAKSSNNQPWLLDQAKEIELLGQQGKK